MIENLETRTHLSVAMPTASAAPMESSALHAAVAKASVATKTTIKVTAGALGQGALVIVTVRDAAASGTPTGTVNIIDHKTVVQTLTLTPLASTSTKFAMAQAEVQLPAGAGQQSYFIGAHKLSATYVSSGSLHASTGNATFHVKTPKYTRFKDGLKVATVEAGSGVGIAAGQTATMEYTGYLAKNGKVFDNSAAHSPGTFSFVVGASPEQVIPGFDEGTLGMEVGETRVLAIPSKLGYGAQGAGSSIPPNSNLVFLITLVSIA